MERVRSRDEDGQKSEWRGSEVGMERVRSRGREGHTPRERWSPGRPATCYQLSGGGRRTVGPTAPLPASQPFNYLLLAALCRSQRLGQYFNRRVSLGAASRRAGRPIHHGRPPPGEGRRRPAALRRRHLADSGVTMAAPLTGSRHRASLNYR